MWAIAVFLLCMSVFWIMSASAQNIADVYTLPKDAKVSLGGPACEVQELIAASKAWAKDSFMYDPDAPDRLGTIHSAHAILSMCAGSETSHCLRMRAAAAEAHEKAQREQYKAWKRWRAALDACP